MRSIILQKLSCSRIAHRTISRHFLPWALAQYRTRRAYKSPTYPQPIMIPSRAPCASASAPSSPVLSGHLRRRRGHTLPPLTPTMTHLQPRPRPYLPPPRANTQSLWYSHPRYPSNDVTVLPLANSELAMGAVDELAPLRDFPYPSCPC
jgi:hypothetical protein